MIAAARYALPYTSSATRFQVVVERIEHAEVKCELSLPA